jgi:hypothetical protein
MCGICDKTENQMPAGLMQSEAGMPQSRMDSIGTDSMPNASMVSGAGGSMPRFEMNATSDRGAGTPAMNEGDGMPGPMSIANAKRAMTMSGPKEHPGNGRSVMPEPDGMR